MYLLSQQSLFQEFIQNKLSKMWSKIYAQGLSLKHCHKSPKLAQHKHLTLEERLCKLCISTWQNIMTPFKLCLWRVLMTRGNAYDIIINKIWDIKLYIRYDLHHEKKYKRIYATTVICLLVVEFQMLFFCSFMLFCQSVP